MISTLFTEIFIYCLIGMCSLAALIGCAVGVRKFVKYLKVANEKPYTFDVALQDHMLETGFYVICGRQRAGKGSLGTAIMDTDCTYHCNERLERAQREIERLNSIVQYKPYNLHLPDFPYRSKNDMRLGPEYRHTYHTDINQFALPGGQKNVQYFPPYTMIHGEEIDAYMNARTWKVDAVNKANVIDAIKWIGHNHLTYIGDAQVFSRLDAAVRALATDIFYVIKRNDFYRGDEPRHWWEFSHKNDNEVVRTEWTFLWVKNQMRTEAAEFKVFGENVDVSEYVKKCKFVYYGNIYSRYNSESGRPYWLKGITDYTVEEHPDTELSRDAVDDFVKRNARSAENADETTES